MAPRLRRSLVEAAWMLMVLALAALLLVARYQDPRRIASGDSFWYMRRALVFSGQSVGAATRTSARLICQDFNRSAVALGHKPSCKRYTSTGFSPRYVAIFTSRPGYPLFAAPFVDLFHAWDGMMAATMVLALAAAALAYLAVWMATGLRLAGAIGSVLMFVLPSGFWMSRMLTEGAVLAGFFAALLGTMLLWRGRPIGLALLVPALTWLFAVRSASGMAVVLCLFGAALLTFIRRPSGVRRAGLLATVGVAVAALAGWVVLSSILRLPSLDATIQDLATTHFHRPDVAHPYAFLIGKNLAYWPGQIRMVLVSPGTLIAALFAFAVLLARMRPVAWLWVTFGLIGPMMQVAHPVRSEWDRMMMSVDIPIACALGYAAALALGRVRQAAEQTAPRLLTTPTAPTGGGLPV